MINASKSLEVLGIGNKIKKKKKQAKELPALYTNQINPNEFIQQ